MPSAPLSSGMTAYKEQNNLTVLCNTVLFALFSSVQVAAVSTVVNHSLLIPFVFSNYTRPHGSVSQFPQSCKYRLWEALRASTAAPGFFEEFKLGKNIHQVGKT